MSACTNPNLYIPWARAAKFFKFQWREVDKTDAVRLPKSTAAPPLSPEPAPRPSKRCRAAPLRRAASASAFAARHRHCAATTRTPSSAPPARWAGRAVRWRATRREPPCREMRRRQSCARRAAATRAGLLGPVGPGRPPLELFFLIFLINYKLFVCYLFIYLFIYYWLINYLLSYLLISFN